MIIQVRVIANHKRLQLEVPLANFLVNIPALAAYDIANRKIIAWGESEEDLENQSPEAWARDRSQIGFATPLDSKSFDSDFAALMLLFYTFQAYKKIRKGWLSIFCFWDRCDYDIQLDGYDEIPTEVRNQFAPNLRKYSQTILPVRKIVINSQIVE